MNCQEISRILDDGRVERLTDDAQQAVKVHLAFCADCAQEWQLHAQLSATAIPPMPAALKERCRTLVAAGTGTPLRVRPRSRFILAGTVLVVAAAAAMVGMQLTDGMREPEPAATAVPAEALAIAQPVTIEAEVDSIVREEGTAVTAESAPAAPAAIPPLPDSFTVSIQPVIHQSDLPASRMAIDSFYTSLAESLRQVPNLVPVDPHVPAAYRVTVQGLAPGRRVMTAGGNMPSATAGNATASEAPDQWRVEVRVDFAGQKVGTSMSVSQTVATVEEIRLDSTATGSSFTSTIASLFPGECAASMAASPVLSTASCEDPVGLAARLVETLRKQVFPADPAVQRQLLARLQARGTGEGARTLTILELDRYMQSGRGTWDAATIQTIVALARDAADPVQRLQILGLLSDSRDPAGVPPLLAAMRSDSDTKVRLGAMQLLQKVHAQYPVVRSALESIAEGDSTQLVREAAKRILYGDAGWRDYVAETLLNTSLSDERRLEPFSYSVQTRELQSQVPAILDAGTATALKEVLHRMWSNPSEATKTTMALGPFVQIDHPVMVDLMIDGLRNAPDSVARMMAITLASGEHRDEPRVREALQEAGAKQPQLKRLLEDRAAQSASFLKLIPPTPAGPAAD